jgi:hypothetical protein
MNTAYEQLIQLLDEREIQYEPNEEYQTIRTDLRGEVATYRVVAHVDADQELFQVFGYSPVRVPEGCRPDIAEAVARANYGLQVGKFELDMNDGELRFQAGHIMTDGVVGEDVIDRLIGTTIAMLERYLPAVLSVIYGNELPKDAIQRVEADMGGRAGAESDEDDGTGA